MCGRSWWHKAACVVVVAAAGCTARVPAVPSGADGSAGTTAGRTTPSGPTRSSGPLDESLDAGLTPVAVTVATDGPPGSLAGLGEAGTVVEYPLTVRRTALVVISRGGSAVVGPLRRATDGDVAVATAFGADLVTSSASTAIVDLFRSRGRRVVEESAPDGAVIRDPARRAPFNVYARIDRVPQRRAASASDSASPWLRDAPEPRGGQPAVEVTVDAAAQVQVAWTWEPTTARWLRTADGRLPQLADGTRVSARTVVVLEVADPGSGLPVRSGEGPAAVLRDGRRHAARWSRDRGGASVSLQSRDGATFAVGGRVWMVVCAAPCAQQIVPYAPRPAGDAR